MTDSKSLFSSPTGYVHGFDKTEQDRLYGQARFLEHHVFSKIDFSNCQSILEVGSGVGAQTKILLEHFPHLTLTCLDASPTQLNRAQTYLTDLVQKQKVTLLEGNAAQLPFSDCTFDGAFICWLLEHTSSPIQILNEVRRTLKPGAPVYITEVFNASLYIYPRNQIIEHYWKLFNDRQTELGGDPNVGIKLSTLLNNAGFTHIETYPLTNLFDQRTPAKRSQMLDYWRDLLLSAASELVKSGKLKGIDLASISHEMDSLKNLKDSIFYYSAIQAKATF